MRLWKVKTWTNLCIETTNLFGRRKRHSYYFTYNTKFIYAHDKDEAQMKYGDLFYNPAVNGYDKDSLSLMKWACDTKSDNLKFDLSFNEKIVHTHEYIYVVEQPVKENIDVIKHNSTANDFRDWLMDGNYEPMSLDELDWLGK